MHFTLVESLSQEAKRALRIALEQLYRAQAQYKRFGVSLDTPVDEDPKVITRRAKAEEAERQTLEALGMAEGIALMIPGGDVSGSMLKNLLWECLKDDGLRLRLYQ